MCASGGRITAYTQWETLSWCFQSGDVLKCRTCAFGSSAYICGDQYRLRETLTLMKARSHCNLNSDDIYCQEVLAPKHLMHRLSQHQWAPGSEERHYALQQSSEDHISVYSGSPPSTTPNSPSAAGIATTDSLVECHV